MTAFCAGVISVGCATGPLEPDAGDSGDEQTEASVSAQAVGSSVVLPSANAVEVPAVAQPVEDPELLRVRSLPGGEQAVLQNAHDAECIDPDGDGFGPNCVLGQDCNEHDPSVTNECYRCLHPNTGCECSTEGQTRACDALTDSDTPSTLGCHPGIRTCATGHWTRCASTGAPIQQVLSAPGSCGSACNPDCRMTTQCPTDPTELTGHGTGVIIGSSTSPLCPSTTPGGITLPGGPTMTTTGCGTTCGGVCCPAGTACQVYTDSTVYPASCTTSGMVPPPPVRQSLCARVCAAGQTQCGLPPNDSCCSAGQVCRQGRCENSPSACPCAAGYFCDTSLNRCIPSSGGACNCEADAAQQSCLASIIATGGRVVNDIFRTATGADARTLRWATYLQGLQNNPTGCPIGRSNFSNTGAYQCTGCTPTVCTSYACYFTAAPRSAATIGPFLNGLDWLWTQHLRTYDDGVTVVPDQVNVTSSTPAPYTYAPWRSRIMDLGAPANRVALFPITDHTSDSCLEPFEYTVWLSDNPNATSIAPANAPDPNRWNQAVLTVAYTRGWTRNPNSLGVPTDTTDLNSLASGDAVADAMTTVWALPCGYSFRYASISAGNNGSPTPQCRFDSADDELDAVAGLNVDGNGLSIYHTLAYGATAGPDGLSFSTQLRTADVYFLMDTTGSMGGAISNLRSAVTSGSYSVTIGGTAVTTTGGLVGAIRTLIPDSWFGVGDHKDIPVIAYGSPPDFTFRHLQDMTGDTSLIGPAVAMMTASGGYDGPESQIPALWAVATGRGLANGYLAERTTCPGGRVGYPCFRPGAIPIVMLFTDAPFHNGPGGAYAYNNTSIFSPVTNISYPAATPVPSRNDTTGTATVLPTLGVGAGVVYSGTTTGYTNDLDPSCARPGSPEAYFRLNLTARSRIHIDTLGTGFDTSLYIIDAGANTVVACNDDYTGTTSQIELTLPAGTYYIGVDGSNGSSGSYTFRYGVLPVLQDHAPTYLETAAALNAIGAKVIVIQNCGTPGNAYCDEGYSHGVALANDTGSLVAGGGVAVYRINANGTGLSTAVINGVSDLANYSRMDVTAVALDNPMTAVDERCFVRAPLGTAPGTVRLSIAAPPYNESDPYPTGRCTGVSSTGGGIPYRALQCLPGTSVNFRAEFANNCVPSTAVAQTFTFDIVVLGNGSYELGRIPVTIVVPPAAYPPSGSFSFDVDATATCGPGSQADWTQLQIDADTPAGTNITVDVQSAPNLANLATSTRIPIYPQNIMPPAVSPMDLGATLVSPAARAAGVSNRNPYLRVNFTLNSDPTRSRAPTLRGYRVLFNCINGT